MSVAPGERGSVAGQCDERDVPADRCHGRCGTGLVEWQDVTVVVLEDVVRGKRGLPHAACLGLAVRAEVGLLHRAHDAIAQARASCRRVDEQEQPLHASGKWPDRDLACNYSAKRRVERFGELGDGHLFRACKYGTEQKTCVAKGNANGGITGWGSIPAGALARPRAAPGTCSRV